MGQQVWSRSLPPDNHSSDFTSQTGSKPVGQRVWASLWTTLVASRLL